ncbi:MAG: PLP-dependent cysteine synthase family protein [Anaerolineales bacterium]
MQIASAQLLQTGVSMGEGLGARVGNTPLFRLNRIAASLPSAVEIHVKAEWFNPSGSVKDRAAANIIRQGLESGGLGSARRLLDSTSGNMGIAYATLAAAAGLRVTLCVPGSASPERITILRALGAEVILTDPSEGSDGAIKRARFLARREPARYWYANQYDNPANWQAHYMTTGPEVLAQTSGGLTHFVAGLGTSGTLMGTGRYLREQLRRVRIVAVQPDAAFHGLEGLKHMPSSIRPGIFDPSFADDTLRVETEEAYAMVRRLAREEGLFVGVSSGAAVAAAIRLGKEIQGGRIVVVLPDGGYKYLSDRALWETA